MFFGNRLISLILLLLLLFGWESLAANVVDDNKVYLVSSHNWSIAKNGRDADPYPYPHPIATKTLNRAKVDFRYSATSWSRAYNSALLVKNCLIIGIARTPERENLFKWIGPVTKDIYVSFYTLADFQEEIRTLDDIKKFRVVTERFSNYQEFLTNNGFDKVELVTSPIQVVEMVARNRVPFLILKDVHFEKLVFKAGLDRNLFSRTYLAFTATEYMAFNRDTSSIIETKVKTAYEQLREEGLLTLEAR